MYELYSSKVEICTFAGLMVIQGLLTFRQPIAGLQGTDFYLGQKKSFYMSKGLMGKIVASGGNILNVSEAIFHHQLKFSLLPYIFLQFNQLNSIQVVEILVENTLSG